MHEGTVTVGSTKKVPVRSTAKSRIIKRGRDGE